MSFDFDFGWHWYYALVLVAILVGASLFFLLTRPVKKKVQFAKAATVHVYNKEQDVEHTAVQDPQPAPAPAPAPFMFDTQAPYDIPEEPSFEQIMIESASESDMSIM